MCESPPSLREKSKDLSNALLSVQFECECSVTAKGMLAACSSGCFRHILTPVLVAHCGFSKVIPAGVGGVLGGAR